MLRTRIITAVIALPLLIFILSYAHPLFVLFFFYMGALVSAYEFMRMFYPSLLNRLNVRQHYLSLNQHCLLALIFISVPFFFVALQGSQNLIFLLAAIFMLMMLVVLFLAYTVDESIANIISHVLTLSYSGVSWLVIWDLYLMRSGAEYIFLLFFIVMSADTGAYFIGSKWGKRPLAKHLSPSKSQEGAIAGIIFATLGAFVAKYLLDLSEITYFVLLLIAVFCSIFGILGDLLESCFKRFSGVKDSGSLLPGHGGVLDRFDAVIAAAPVMWIVLWCLKLT